MRCTFCEYGCWKDMYHDYYWNCVLCTPSQYCHFDNPHDEECEFYVEYMQIGKLR